MLFRQLLVNGVETGGVAGAVIGWNMHAGQQYFSAGILTEFYDFAQSLADAVQGLAAQRIVAAQFDNHHAGPMAFEQVRQSSQSALSGFATD